MNDQFFVVPYGIPGIAQQCVPWHHWSDCCVTRQTRYSFSPLVAAGAADVAGAVSLRVLLCVAPVQH